MGSRAARKYWKQLEQQYEGERAAMEELEEEAAEEAAIARYESQPVEYEFCCEKFEKAATSAIEFEEGWHINGCCGSCYVLTDIEFCPFCGMALAEPIHEDKSDD